MTAPALNTPLMLGISCLHYAWGPLEEAFARARDEFGLHLIEFSTTRLEGDDYDRCGRLAADTGIRTSLHAWKNPADLGFAAAVDEGTRLLDLCLRMRAKYLILHFGSHPERDEGIQLVADVCRELAPLYEAAGVTYCLENHYPFAYRGLNELGGEPADFHLLFEQVDSPAVRFCLDTGHSNMAGATRQFVAELADKLAYAHLTDNHGEHDDHLGFEEGTLNWDETLAAMLESGFRGPYVIEYPEQGDSSRFARLVARLRELAAAAYHAE